MTEQFLTDVRLRQRRKGLTLACRRPPIAYAPASLRPLAAPEARRSALYTSWGQSPVFRSLLECAFTHYREEHGYERLGRSRTGGVPDA